MTKLEFEKAKLLERNIDELKSAIEIINQLVDEHHIFITSENCDWEVTMPNSIQESIINQITKAYKEKLAKTEKELSDLISDLD